MSAAAGVHTNQGKNTRLQGAGLWLARAGWLLILVIVGTILWEMVPTNYANTALEWTSDQTYLGVRSLLTYRAWITLLIVLETLVAAVFFAAATIIIWKRSDEWFALYVSQTLLLMAVISISSNLDMLRMPAPVNMWLPTEIVRVFLSGWLPFSLVVIFFVFPDGRFVPNWSRWIVWSTLLLFVGLTIDQFLEITPRNMEVGWGASLLVFLVILPTGAACQLYRYRREATLLQRQQSKWVVIGFVAFSLAYLLSAIEILFVQSERYAGISAILLLLRFPIYLLIPLGMLFALLRYRLWDVDAILRRTLVYGLLTATILLLYALIIGSVGALFQGEGNWLLPVIVTALVALLFHPLRMWLQDGVDRMLYGQRGNPLVLLRSLGNQLEGTLPPEELFQNLVDTVAGALKLPWVALELSHTGSLATTTVSETGRRAIREATMEIERFPLVHQGVALGALVVGARAEGESLTAADRQVLESIAAQASPAIQAARLNVRLQQSRQAIVAAREEERRRLRRDLHDGLGPQLASQTLTIDAILRLQKSDPEQTRTLLLDLKRQSQDAIHDIRRIVYDLRPPALDDLGLIEALRESAARTEQAGIPVTLVAPESLPHLPAAVESNAWYIAREGLANAVRHSKATTVTLQISVEEETLLIQIVDNGVGVSADSRPGVGLLSMRERAMEVGGNLTVENYATGGTGIAARLPIVFNTRMSGNGDAS